MLKKVCMAQGREIKHNTDLWWGYFFKCRYYVQAVTDTAVHKNTGIHIELEQLVCEYY